jgi:hypothetical protein
MSQMSSSSSFVSPSASSTTASSSVSITTSPQSTPTTNTSTVQPVVSVGISAVNLHLWRTVLLDTSLVLKLRLRDSEDISVTQTILRSFRQSVLNTELSVSIYLPFCLSTARKISLENHWQLLSFEQHSTMLKPVSCPTANSAFCFATSG